MDINYRAISKITGIIMCVLSLSMLLPTITGLVYSETVAVWSFFLVSVIVGIVGIVIIKLSKTKSETLKMRDGAIIVAISWFLFAIVGAIPLVVSGSVNDFFTAFFEMSSGFTTTGATAIGDVEALPKAVLFWRCFSHWIGGMGILVFTIAFLPSIGFQSQQIAAAEVPSPTPLSKISAKISDTARYLYFLYLAFTIIETILLLLGGMNFFDALTHSFSTIGSGGFANYNDSIAHFGSSYINVVIMIFMLIAGMNFNLFFVAFKNGISSFVKDEEWRMYIFIVIFASIFVSFGIFIGESEKALSSAVSNGFFHVISILTTTGFSLENYALWHTFSQISLLILFFIGGSSSSTSGGIKVIRVIVFLKLIKRGILKRLHQNNIFQIKINSKPIQSTIITNIFSFILIYIGLAMIVALILSLDGHDFITSVSASFSCLGNIGLAFGDVDPAHTYETFSSLSKFTLSIVMIAGRLEVFTLFMLFTKRFWNPFK